MSIYAILLAAGSGTRMNAGVNKVLLSVAGEACVRRSARAFLGVADQLAVVTRPEDMAAVREAVAGLSFPLPTLFVEGGLTRQESVFNGVSAIGGQPSDFLLIHDAARCLVSEKVIRNVLDDIAAYGSGIPAVPVSDTVRMTDGEAARLIDRSRCFAMQTPQGFRLSDFREAIRKAGSDGFEGTDDAAVLEHAGYPIHLSEGDPMNMKLTTPSDLKRAEAFLRPESPVLLTGHGYDVHRLVPGRKLILCGVEIPHGLGLLGHSDADVAVHALMDALLGAAGLGDIGQHFPDTDPAYEGISSLLLLEHVMQLLTESGFRPVNTDLTIVAQKPKLAPYIPEMRKQLSARLGLAESRVNVKATTTEHLGFEGRMEGISATAVCLIEGK